MTALDAVYQLLQDVNRPLPIGEITRQIIERGLWTTQGATPSRTVSAALSVDLTTHREHSRFIRIEQGIYSLNPNYLLEAPALDEVPGVQVQATLSFTDAAEQILDNYAGRQPMHYQDITSIALEKNLVTTQGLTPASTMYAQITTEIQRKMRRGEQPRFVMHGQGLVGLFKWETPGLASLIEKHNQDIRNKLLQRLQAIPADEFEKLIAQLLTAMGFEDVIVTAFRGDQGVDVKATLVVGSAVRTRMAVQVKKWKNNIQAPVVQQVRGSLSTHEAGLIITTSDFSRGAVKEANLPDRIPVALMNGKQLVTLLIENNIGVTRQKLDLIELVEVES